MGTASRLKVLVAQSITAPWIGRVVRLIYGDAIPFHGARIASRSPFVSPVVSAKLFWGIYEGAERRFVQKYLSPDLPVIELGSSIGGISSHIARKLSAGQRLICVEANPHLIPVLERNLGQNGAHLAWQVMHAAIATDPGEVSFSVSASSLSSSVAVRSDAVETISAPARRLTDVLADTDVSEFQLVMDIEGAEAGIVRADVISLDRCRRIIAELHRTDYDGAVVTVDELIGSFQDAGFDVRDQHGPVVVFERREGA